MLSIIEKHNSIVTACYAEASLVILLLWLFIGVVPLRTQGYAMHPDSYRDPRRQLSFIEDYLKTP